MVLSCLLPSPGGLRAQPGHGDDEEPADCRLGRQAPGGGEGVQAVAGKLARRDVGPDLARLGAGGEQVGDQVLELLPRPAKALVLAAAVVATGIGACLAAYLVFQAFLPAGDAMRTTLADPGVLRAVTGAGLYLTVLGLLGFGLGTVFRSSGGAVAVLFGVLFVPTLLTALLPSSWQDTLGPYLPMNAGDTIYTVRPEAHMLGPWAGFGVYCLYAAAALAAGFVLIGRRDA